MSSENVDVSENSITTRVGGASIMLIDQSRAKPSGGKYLTSGNFIYNNAVTVSGGGYVGGASDAGPGDENFAIIEKDGNRFDNNTYKAKDSKTGVSFVWGHEVYDWSQFKLMGQETGASLSCDEPDSPDAGIGSRLPDLLQSHPHQDMMSPQTMDLIAHPSTLER